MRLQPSRSAACARPWWSPSWSWPRSPSRAPARPLARPPRQSCRSKPFSGPRRSAREASWPSCRSHDDRGARPGGRLLPRRVAGGCQGRAARGFPGDGRRGAGGFARSGRPDGRQTAGKTPSAGPARQPSKPGSKTVPAKRSAWSPVTVRVFVDAGYTAFRAKSSFDAIFGTSSALFPAAAERWGSAATCSCVSEGRGRALTGVRAFVFDDEVFPLASRRPSPSLRST